MKKNYQWLQTVLLGACALIIGAFIFFQTENFAMFMVIAVGIFAIVNGIIVLRTLNRAKFSKMTRNAILIRGIVSLVIGIFAVGLPVATAKFTWTFMLYVLGVQLILSALFQLFAMFEMRRLHLPVMSQIIEAAIALALAIMIFTMPQEIGQTILKVVGVLVVVYGIIMVASGLKKHGKTLDTIVVEAEEKNE